MSVQRLVLGGVLSVCVGCTNILGLDGMSYDREDQIKDATPAPEEPEDSINLGGAPGIHVVPPLSADNSYPRLWRASQMLVSAAAPQNDTRFLVYDRQTGMIEAHSTTASSFEVAATWQWTANYSLVIEIPSSVGREKLVGYDAATGIVEYADLEKTKPGVQGITSSGSARWTHLVAVPFEGSWGLLSYNKENGHYRFRGAEFDVEPGAIHLGDWKAGFSHVLAYPLGTTELASERFGILKFDTDTGEAELDEILPNGEGTRTLSRGNLGAGWTIVSTFRHDGEPSLLLYEARRGRVCSGFLELGTSFSFKEQKQSVWREGISSIQALEIHSVPFAVTHSAQTNVVDVLQVFPFESLPSPR